MKLSVFYIIIRLFFLFIPFLSYSQKDSSSLGQKKGMFGFLKKKEEETPLLYEPNKFGSKKGFPGLRKKKNEQKKDKDLVLPDEKKKWIEGQNLTDEEIEKLDKIIEKYKLTDEEKQVKAMWDSGEPLNKKGKKTLQKANKKNSILVEKIRKFHIERNYNIQSKEVKKRMKKNRKEANKRMRK